MQGKSKEFDLYKQGFWDKHRKIERDYGLPGVRGAPLAACGAGEARDLLMGRTGSLVYIGVHPGPIYPSSS